MIWLLAGQLAAAPFSSLYVFGDSLSEMGNVFAATHHLIPSDPPYFRGRFSKGPVWVEHLAEQLGLPLIANGGDPTVIQGNNFAAGGADRRRQWVEAAAAGLAAAVQTLVLDAPARCWCPTRPISGSHPKLAGSASRTWTGPFFPGRRARPAAIPTARCSPMECTCRPWPIASWGPWPVRTVAAAG